MAWASDAIPYGIEDMKVYVLDSADAPGSAVDVPGIRGFTYTEESDSDEWEGDNSIIAVARQPTSLTGTVELGIIKSTVFAAFIGGTASTSGTTPNQITTLESAADKGTRYVQIVGQAPDKQTNGSAYRVTVYKAQVTSGPDETMSVNEWNGPTLDYTAVSLSGNLLKRQWYETEAAVS
jgi:hypothetical protein